MFEEGKGKSERLVFNNRWYSKGQKNQAKKEVSIGSVCTNEQKTAQEPQKPKMERFGKPINIRLVAPRSHDYLVVFLIRINLHMQFFGQLINSNVRWSAHQDLFLRKFNHLVD